MSDLVGNPEDRFSRVEARDSEALSKSPVLPILLVKYARSVGPDVPE